MLLHINICSLSSLSRRTKTSSVIVVSNLHYYQNIDIVDKINWNASNTFGDTFKLPFNRDTITITRINTSTNGLGMD